MLRGTKIIPVPLPDLNTTSITFNKNDSERYSEQDMAASVREDNEVDFTWIPTGD
ncbi:hypothetical protein MASR1M45_29870 [Candidatus Kapaibacterium sp.]